MFMAGGRQSSLRTCPVGPRMIGDDDQRGPAEQLIFMIKSLFLSIILSQDGGRVDGFLGGHGDATRSQLNTFR